MRGSTARTLVPALVVLALVGAVAVAATGTTPAGTSEGRKPSDTLLDTFFSLGLVLLLPAAALFVYGLMQRKDVAREMASGRYPRRTVATYLVLAAAIGVAYYLNRNRQSPLGGEAEEDVGAIGGATRPPDVAADDPNAYQAEFAWIPVLVVVALAATALAAYLLAARRRRAAVAGDASVHEELASALEDTLDDLRAEPDPRRAVIAAFARLERTLASVGAPRRRSETAEEYVRRVLELLDVGPDAIGRLTALFERAKFSHHEIDAAMKEAAIAALEHVRDELRQAAERALSAEVVSVPERGERVAAR